MRPERGRAARQWLGSGNTRAGRPRSCYLRFAAPGRFRKNAERIEPLTGHPGVLQNAAPALAFLRIRIRG